MGPAGRIGCQETERVGVRGSDVGGGLQAVLAIGPGVERSAGRAALAEGQVRGPGGQSDGQWEPGPRGLLGRREFSLCSEGSRQRTPCNRGLTFRGPRGWRAGKGHGASGADTGPARRSPVALHVRPTTPRPRLQTPPLPPRPTPATAPQPSSHPRPTPLATGVPSQQPMSSCHQGPMLGFISVSPSPRQPRRACQSLPAAFQSQAPGTPCGSVVSFRSRGIPPDATDPARRLELLICPWPTCDPPPIPPWSSQSWPLQARQAVGLPPLQVPTQPLGAGDPAGRSLWSGCQEPRASRPPG